MLGLQPLTAWLHRPSAGRPAATGQATDRLRAASSGGWTRQAPLRARDLVGDGPRRASVGARAASGGRRRRQRVAEILAAVGATALRRHAGRHAVRRRAAAGADRPGAGDRPRLLLCDEPLAVARPAPPARGRPPDRRSPPSQRHRRAVRDPRDQPGAAVRRPGAVPGRRPVPDRQRRRGADLPTPVRRSTARRIEVLRVDGRIVVVGVPDRSRARTPTTAATPPPGAPHDRRSLSRRASRASGSRSSTSTTTATCWRWCTTR